MARMFSTWPMALLGVVGVACAAGGAWWLINLNGEGDPSPASGNASFREMATEAGLDFRMTFLAGEQGEKFKINLYDHGCGVAIGDVDNDGHDDVYLVNQLGKNRLFRNKGDGTFEDITDKAGVGLGDRVCVAATFADIDNDGLPELYVTSTNGGNVLFKNLGGGKFKNITEEAGLKLVAHSQTAVFFDFDGDGLLDLFVTNTAQWTLPTREGHYYPGVHDIQSLIYSPIEHNVLYRNKGNGKFEDVTEKAGLKGKGWGGDVAVFDFDGDGRLDLLVTNMFGASQLYRNTGNGTFTDVTKKVLGRTSYGAIGCKAFDFNNDGRLDVLIADMHSDMWLPPEEKLDERTLGRDWARKKFPNIMGPLIANPNVVEIESKLKDALKLNYDDVLFGNTLFKQQRDGTFKEVSDKAGMETWWPWGVATGDFDNDGFEDVFLPSGMGYPFGYWPSALMMNNGDETFTDRAREAGIDPPPGGIHLPDKIGGKPAARSSRCAAVADFDGDGRLDLVVNNFNDRAFYFRNQFARKNYVAFRLEGTRCNRDAIGALVTLHSGKEVMVRQVHAAGGYLSQSSRTVHFGLGERAQVDYVEIRWPGSKTRQRIDHPEINQLRTVKQSDQ